VLAINDRPEAASGENPNPIRIAAVTATGVPNPDAPSKNAPKEKAISNNWMRRSAETPPIACCKVANAPVARVSRYMKMTFSTIQPIGKKPVIAPRIAARIASPAGIVNRKTAIRIATSSATSAAMCVFTRPEAISIKRVTTGIAAARVDNAALPNGS
jgi:hypothetical protein